MKFLAVVLLFCGVCAAQRDSKPLDGQPWELSIWGSGGFSVPGGTKDTQMMNAGLRFGKVLTADLGPSLLRGNFEWSADVIPVYYFWQPAPGMNTYAAGFNPVNLTWNFTKGAKTVPYLELGGGVIFSDNPVPAGTNKTNFLTHAALGFRFFVRDRHALTFSTRYEHVSNAGLATPNPGINTVQFLVGWNWLK
jgi:lipid A 3-O-deacylase